MNKLNQLFKQQIELIKPDKETFDKIKEASNEFVKYLELRLKKKMIKADVFVGGSLAKGTLVRKGVYDSEERKSSASQTFSKKVYDVDIFVRFDGEKYKDDEISGILGKALSVGKGVKKIHGSRDYYQKIVEGIVIEIIPVLKIKKPEDAENVMDLSYFHVNYLLKKIKKKKKLVDEIILAKSFCHAHNCYGAESYIRGFSGYSLELLICYYGSFKKFLEVVVKDKGKRKSGVEGNEKIIIDDSKFYKKTNVLYELNESKLNSPIILIDPTYKERNALAGLSKETFDRFKEISKKFLKEPTMDFFKVKNIEEELKKKYGKVLKVIEVKTNKQVGDIAGTKSKKFFEFFNYAIKKEFEIKTSEFNYNDEKNIAKFYFVLDKKKDEIVKGPFMKDKKNVARFKKVHKKIIKKNGSVYAKIKHDLSFEKWFELFLEKEKKILKQMSVKGIDLIKN